MRTEAGSDCGAPPPVTTRPRWGLLLALVLVTALTWLALRAAPDRLEADSAHADAPVSLNGGQTGSEASSSPAQPARVGAGAIAQSGSTVTADPYQAPLKLESDEVTWLGRESLARILTPTSDRDMAWMTANLYPRQADLTTPDLDRLLGMFEGPNPINPLRDRAAHDYAANVLAAHFWESGDPRWAEFARLSSSPFARALELADVGRRYERGQATIDEYNRAWLRAFAWGERSFAQQLHRVLGNPNPRGADATFMNDVAGSFREFEQLNGLITARGGLPLSRDARPAPPWMPPP